MGKKINALSIEIIKHFPTRSEYCKYTLSLNKAKYGIQEKCFKPFNTHEILCQKLKSIICKVFEF